MSRIRVAVVGCGAISQEHFRYLGNSELVDLAAVCDVSPSAGRYAVDRFGATMAYTDAATMLAEARPEAVHILTPPGSHRALVEQCLRADAHVICEKPITFTSDELVPLLSLAGERGRWLLENHNYRFNDQTVALDGYRTSGALGAVHSVDVVMSVPMPDSDLGAPAGAVHDYITHASYLVLHLLGDRDVDDVRARWRLTGPGRAARYDDLAALIGVGDSHATIRISGVPRPMAFRVVVRGSKGAVETDMFQPYLRADLERGDAQLGPLVNHAANGFGLLKATARNLGNKILQKGAYHGLDRFLAMFYEALATGGPPPVTEAQLVRSSKLIDALVAEAGR